LSAKRLHFLLFHLVLSVAGAGVFAKTPAPRPDSARLVADTTARMIPDTIARMAAYPEGRESADTAVPVRTAAFPLVSIDSIPQEVIDSMLGRASVPPDTLSKKPKKQAVDAPVTYSASDSIVYLIRQQKVYLYDAGHIEYKTITLDAAYIDFDMGSETVYAIGVTDSLGEEVGKPQFTEGSQSFQARKMSYNFRSKKGIITDIFTEQEGGYLHSAITKRQPDDHIHMKNGKYTTCDASHPHYYIALTKAISIPGDKIVSGPAYIVLEDVPLPIGIPFGFFPSNQINQSGFLLPTYGEEERRGFYLRNGGFYFALNQYFDLAVTGDVYTNGTWGIRTRSNYRKNYKFSGNFGINYFENIEGEKGLENYRKTKDFAIRWSHAQDNRANPNQNFRASVDYSTTAYDQNHQQNINNVLRSTKRSSISYSRVWPNTPFNLSAGVDATQNSQTGIVDFNLPTMNFNMNRIYPLKRRHAGGSSKWYEKLTVSYSATLANKLSAQEDSLLQKLSYSDFDNGYQHSIPVSLPLNFLNYFTLSPSIRYNGVVFTKSIHPRYFDGPSNPSGSMSDTLIIDTIPGFHYAHAIVPSVGLSFTPKIYGMYQFREKSRIEAIRHVMSPSASVSFTPDMKGAMPDYYQEVVIDSTDKTRIYPKYDESINRTPVPSGRQGSVSLSLKNNIEMKLKSRSDTTDETTKVKLLDNLNFTTNYNIFKDSLKWSPIRMSGNTAFFKRKVSFRFGGTLDPYAYYTTESGRSYVINKAYLVTSKRLFRITSLDFSVGMNFSSKQGKKQGEEDQMALANDATANLVNPTGFDQIAPASYVDFEIPWTFGMDYNFRYTKPYGDYNIIQSLRVRGDFSLTPKWKIGFNSGYDFKTKKVTTTNVSIHRDLHCWEMQVSMVPFGKYRSYSFQINIKSAILHDLMYEKGDTWYDNF
jgi:hypothetical protein